MHSPSRDDPEELLAEAGFVRRLARTLLRDDALADDVSQDVLVAALQQPEPPRHWRGWLAAVTRRLAGRAQRARSTRRRHELALAGDVDDDPQRRTRERLQLHQQLTAAVLALPEPYRTVVTLRFLDGLPPRAIARRTGANADVVRQRLRRGLAMLRERLDRSYGSRRAWLVAFASGGLGSTTVPLLTLSVLAMNKLLIAAFVVVAGGALALSVDWSAEPERASPSHHAASTPAPAASVVVAPPHPTERVDVTPAIPRCEVTVFDEYARALPRATVFCWDPDGEVVEGTTDEHGRAMFAGGGQGGVLAIHEGHAPRARQLKDIAGEHHLQLDRGGRVAGTLFIDGELAPPGQRLRLWGAGQHVGEVPEALASHLSWPSTTWLEVGRDGGFDVTGVPIDWRGALYFGDELWLLPSSGGSRESFVSYELDAPRAGLELHTTRLPLVEGRVVWDDDGAPVADGFLAVRGFFDGGIVSPMTAAETRADGTFRVGLSPSSQALWERWCDPERRPPLDRVSVRARARDAVEAVDANVDAQQLARGPIEVRLQRAAQRHFLVLDEAGEPLAGARVQGRGVSDATDEDGRGTFRGELDDVLVGAPGHRTGPLSPRSDARGTEEDPCVFVLSPTNRVTLRCVAPDGAPVAGLSLTLASARAPFAGGRHLSAIDQHVHGVSALSEVLGDGLYKAGLALSRDGTCELSSLEPGVELRAVVRDAAHHDVLEVPFVAPPLGEHASVTLALPRAPREVALRFVDPDGGPVGRVVVRLGGATRRTDDDGVLRLAPILADSPIVGLVKTSGFLPMQFEARPSIGDAPQQVTLQRARAVTVTVLDADGERVDVGVRARGLATSPQHVEPGLSRFDMLPAGEVTFTASFGGATYEVVHDTREPNATLRVPTPARLTFAVPGAWPTTSEGAHLEARVTCLDTQREPGSIWGPERPEAAPLMLLPGRYRVELFEVHGAARVPLRLTAEVELRAGETTQARLR